MKITEIVSLVAGELKGAVPDDTLDFENVFASDLMSDVLKVSFDGTLLVTGLCNNQTMRTADMADISLVVIGRGKKADEEMLEIALDSDITIIESPFSIFKISGILYQAGLRPLY